MDRRAKKLEKKRKTRENAKKQARAVTASRPSAEERLIERASRAPFGPCWLSATWDDMATGTPDLVTVVITRSLEAGLFLPAVALVDRTCLGAKDGFFVKPALRSELDDFLATLPRDSGGFVSCEPLVAQSVVFHAIAFARKLGFAPARDFPATLFGPRPAELIATPWHAVERPFYLSGPHDDERAIKAKLTAAVGAGNFDYVNVAEHVVDLEDDDDDEPEEDEDAWLLDESRWATDEGELVHSPLERSVTQDGVTVKICIYRGRAPDEWLLEVENPLGGSTVWDDPFPTDQAALDEALGAIEKEGIASFSEGTTKEEER